MSSTEEILKALGARKDHGESWYTKNFSLVDGVASSLMSGSSSSFKLNPSVTSVTRGEVSIVGSVLEVLIVFPTMIDIAMSNATPEKKLRELAPLSVRLLLGIAIMILGILVFNAIGGLALATVFAAVSLFSSLVFLGISAYRVWQAKAENDQELNNYSGETLVNEKKILREQINNPEFKSLTEKLSDNKPLTDNEKELVKALDKKLKTIYWLTREANYERNYMEKNNKKPEVGLRKQIAKENLLASVVNALFSGTGVVAALIGLLMVVVFVAAPPAFGITLGVLGFLLALVSVGKAIYEWKLKQDEVKHMEQSKQAFLTEAIHSLTNENKPIVQPEPEPVEEVQLDEKEEGALNNNEAVEESKTDKVEEEKEDDEGENERVSSKL